MDNDKRMAGDYKITNALYIGDKEVVMGESTKGGKPEYMVAFCEYNDLFACYTQVLASENYAEIVAAYGERIKAQAEQVLTEEKALDIPITAITKADCIPDKYDQSIEGKVIAVDPDVLRAEYRRADRQLYLVTGGFGAAASSRGSAVFCTNLHTGEHTRYERRDVMGEVKKEALPDWAKAKLAELEKSKPKKNKEHERHCKVNMKE